MSLHRHLCALILIAASGHASAAITIAEQNNGTWRSQDGKTLTVNPQGVQNYSKHAAVCQQNTHYAQFSETIQGQTFKTQMQEDLEGQLMMHAELKDDEEFADVLPDLSKSIAVTQKALPLIQAQQKYESITFECIDNTTHLVFLNANQALEKVYMGGEVSYYWYTK